MSSLTKRTLSGAVFVAIMLAGLLGGKYAFGMLTLFMAAGMTAELVRVSGWKNWPVIFAGIVYIGFSMAVMNAIAFSGGVFSGKLLLCLFIIVWASDVGAYCIGSTIGQKAGSRKLAPRISPNKSWAGYWGGLLFCIAAAAVLNLTGMLAIPMVHCIAAGIIIHCMGVFGDLLESIWKRHFGVKDSGKIIPGHGGLLDRFDSSLLAIPSVFAYLLLFDLI
jgi:phosphatidate cytidylyltransferase